MKILKERTEIAKAMNFGKYPVIAIDTNNAIEMCGKIVGYRGPKVRVPWDYHGEKLYHVCQVNYWFDEQNISISCGGIMLKSDFGCSDIIEMAEYANAPILDKNQEFVLVVYNSKKKETCYPILMKTKDYKDITCLDVLSVEEKIDLR